MADIDKQELRRLAEAATKSQWRLDGEYINEHGNLIGVYIAHANSGRIAEFFANCRVKTDEECRANAAFVAMANPAAILSLLDELESQAQQFKDWQASHYTNYCSVAEERDQLRAELEALRKDAERWRFVRSPLGTGSPYAVWHEGRMPIFSAIADACIDEAMAKEGGA